MKLGSWVDDHKRKTKKRQGMIAAEMGLTQPDLSAYCNEKRLPLEPRRKLIETFTNGAVRANSAEDWVLLPATIAEPPKVEPGHFYPDPNDANRVIYVLPPKVPTNE